MNKSIKDKYKPCLAAIILCGLVLFFVFGIIREGIPTYSLVQPREYYSGIIRMRAEGIENLYYEDYDDFLTFITNYIGERRVRLSKQVENAGPVGVLCMFACPQERIYTNDELSSDPRYEKIKYCYPSFTYDNCIFVVDNYWNTSNEIVAFWVDSDILFCSVEEYSDLLYNREEYLFTESKDVFEYMNEIHPSKYRIVTQILIILSIQYMGLWASLIGLKGEYKYLAFAISFPVGSALICLLVMGMDLIGIPFGVGSLSILFAVLVSVLFGICCKKRYHDVKGEFFFLLASTIVLISLATLKMNYSGPDSLFKILLGRRLAMYGTINDLLETAIQFGVYEISLHGVSNILGVEVFNLIYPYMSCACIAIMIVLTLYFSTNASRVITYASCALGVLVLTTNSDYFLLSFWILSNGIMGAFFLIVASFMLLSARENIDLSIFIMLSSFVIITTRLEGAMFVCLTMALALLFDIKGFQVLKAVIGSVVLVIAWNLCLMIKLGFIPEGTFWTTAKGWALVLFAATVLLIAFVRDRIARLNISIWTKRYIIITVLAFLCSFVAFVIKSDAFIENYRPYLYHLLGKSDKSNSYILWTVILIETIVGFWRSNDYKKYSSCLVVIYLLMVFDIMLFRTGYPIHYAENDSSRRMIVHIMPFAIWSSSFWINEMLSRLTGRLLLGSD